MVTVTVHANNTHHLLALLAVKLADFIAMHLTVDFLGGEKLLEAVAVDVDTCVTLTITNSIMFGFARLAVNHLAFDATVGRVAVLAPSACCIL